MEKFRLRRSLVNSGEVARTLFRGKNRMWYRKPYETRGMVEVARTRANFSIKSCRVRAETVESSDETVVFRKDTKNLGGYPARLNWRE